jgi:hypothetical protein
MSIEQWWVVIGRESVMMCCLVRVIDEYRAMVGGDWQGVCDDVLFGQGYR